MLYIVTMPLCDESVITNTPTINLNLLVKKRGTTKNGGNENPSLEEVPK